MRPPRRRGGRYKGNAKAKATSLARLSSDKFRLRRYERQKQDPTWRKKRARWGTRKGKYARLKAAATKAMPTLKQGRPDRR